MSRENHRIIFPGDPEYDRPNPTRDWHYVITVASIVVMLFSAFVGVWLIAASLITFIVALLTSPPDLRYP